MKSLLVNSRLGTQWKPYLEKYNGRFSAKYEMIDESNDDHDTHSERKRLENSWKEYGKWMDSRIKTMDT